jgi:hypothetical protein
MKLIRWGEADQEKIGVIINDTWYDTSSFGGDYNEQFFNNDGLVKLGEFLKANEGNLPVVPAGTRLGSPIARPSKIVCIGLNYDRWHICHDACSFGRELKVPVYQFLKGPLIRKYGADWFAELENTVSSNGDTLNK